MKLFQDAWVWDRRRQILAEKTEERPERARHGQNVGHVFLLLSCEEKILSLIGHPKVRDWGIVRSGEYRLADIGKNQALKEQSHPTGDGRPGTVNKTKFTRALQLLEIGCCRSRKREPYSV